MNKSPDKMKIHDALDLFEKYGAEIVFKRNNTCNLNEQIGKLVTAQDLLSGNNKELSEKVKKAIELVKAEFDKGTLKELLEMRVKYRNDLSPELQKYYSEPIKPVKPSTKNMVSMKINEALDLFESLGAEILFRASNVYNLNEQIGRIVIEKDLLSGSNPELSNKIRGAISIIKVAFKSGTLESLIETRQELKKARESQKRNTTQSQVPPRKETTYREQGSESGSKKNATRQENNTGRQQKNQGYDERYITFIRKTRDDSNGSLVQIIEIPSTTDKIEPRLPDGKKITLIPPRLYPEALAEVSRIEGKPANIKRYLIMEISPDKKRMHINFVFGNLDLIKMQTDPQYLNAISLTALSRKRINNICRNNFGLLDSGLKMERNALHERVVSGSILRDSIEIKTAQTPSLFQGIFGRKTEQKQNVLRVYKTGIMLVNGKQCSVFSYGTKDETTGDIPQMGSFIVSNFDEERFMKDTAYRNAVISNVFTPSRLYNSRRADIEYPYLGGITENGTFENDFEISDELNNIFNRAKN